ncbi:hypothetical protein [Nostoc sp. UHCC 0926]|uniref:hypothetical protein n=2 Tax=Nostoc TaxID=1177 RepID=UPI003081ED24
MLFKQQLINLIFKLCLNLYLYDKNQCTFLTKLPNIPASNSSQPNDQNPLLMEIPMKELMKQPSSWLPNGIKLNLSDQFRPFSFTEELQIRLEELLEKNKENLLNPDEQAELAGLLELEKIFSFINAKLAS